MSEPVGTTRDTEDALLGLGSATVSESGGWPLRSGLRPVWSGAVLAAPVLPVWCRRSDNLAAHHAVAGAPPGVALVVAVEGGPDHGWWGEVLTVAAQSRGIAGLVIDACVRDTAAIAARRFPVWAQGISLPGAAKVAAGRIGEPIDIRGCTVTAGDWVVADADGVAIIAAAGLTDVLAAGRARADREAELFARLRAGSTTVELLGLPPPT